MSENESVNIFSNAKLDMIFVERGDVFNQILEGSKEIHQMAIEEDRTDLLDFNHWLLLQFYCFQMQVHFNDKLREEFN